MARTGGAWIPDGRAKAIRADCEASLAALDGLPIDLYLIHAPDPRTPWRTSVRALARLVDEGLVRRVGLANVNRRQLDEALELAPIAAVQVALSPFDDRALRGGVVERCAESGHRRDRALAARRAAPRRRPRPSAGAGRGRGSARRDPGRGRARVAARPLAGGRRDPGRAAPGDRALRRAAPRRSSSTRTSAQLLAARVRRASPGSRERPRPADDGEVVLVMGIPGAGKSRVAEEYVARGYLRLNRDERGGSLRELADALDEALSSGARRVVLDNTYLTRAARSYVIEAASRHGSAARCVWLDTPLAQAQVNLVERLLERFGSLPTPGGAARAGAARAGRARADLPDARAPRARAAVDRRGIRRRRAGAVRAHAAVRRARAGVFVAAAALRQPGWERALEQGDRDAPHLVFDWSPDGTADALDDAVARLSAEVSGPVESALCPHPAGPPSCWCRPPLPGLPLAFARAHGVDPSRSILVGTGPAHRTLATTLGARYVAAQ